jgi:hypothetical protein
MVYGIIYPYVNILALVALLDISLELCAKKEYVLFEQRTAA